MGSDLHTQAGFIATVCNLRPQSRWHARIKSPDVTITSAITQNFLSHEADRVVAVEGMQLTRRLLVSQALARFAPEELRPGPGGRR
jgi:choline dehydrogenase